MEPRPGYTSIAQTDSYIEVEDKSSAVNKRSVNFLSRFQFLVVCSHVFIFIIYSSILYFRFGPTDQACARRLSTWCMNISDAICSF